MTHEAAHHGGAAKELQGARPWKQLQAQLVTTLQDGLAERDAAEALLRTTLVDEGVQLGDVGIDGRLCAGTRFQQLSCCPAGL